MTPFFRDCARVADGPSASMDSVGTPHRNVLRSIALDPRLTISLSLSDATFIRRLPCRASPLGGAAHEPRRDGVGSKCVEVGLAAFPPLGYGDPHVLYAPSSLKDARAGQLICHLGEDGLVGGVEIELALRQHLHRRLHRG